MVNPPISSNTFICKSLVELSPVRDAGCQKGGFSTRTHFGGAGNDGEKANLSRVIPV